MPTDTAPANENEAPQGRIVPIEESCARMVARGWMTPDEAARVIDDAAGPGAADRYRGWLVTPQGGHKLFSADANEAVAEGYLREAIDEGLGTLGYITRYGRLLYHVGRSRSLRLLP